MTENDLIRARATIQQLTAENHELLNKVNALVREVCGHCGRFPDEKIGACDRCKWRTVRKEASL